MKQVELTWLYGLARLYDFERFFLFTVLQELDGDKFFLHAVYSGFLGLPPVVYCIVPEFEFDNMSLLCLELFLNVVYLTRLISHWSDLAQSCPLRIGKIFWVIFLAMQP